MSGGPGNSDRTSLLYLAKLLCTRSSSPSLCSMTVSAGIFFMWYDRRRVEISSFLASYKGKKQYSERRRKERRSLLTATGGELASNI